MSLPEHEKQELVVGLYDRGRDLEASRKILDIGSSKTLKSGIWSPYLVNFRPVLSLDQDSHMLLDEQGHIRELFLKAMALELESIDNKFFHVFGPPEAGTPLASAVSGVSGHSLLWQRVIPKKGYGTHQTLEGVYSPGQPVVEIDDVITDGGTKKEGKELLEANGLRVTGVVVGFDREQGGRKAVEDMGIKFRATLGATASFGYLLDARRLSQAEHDYLVEYTENPAPTQEPASHPWKT